MVFSSEGLNLSFLTIYLGGGSSASTDNCWTRLTGESASAMMIKCQNDEIRCVCLFSYSEYLMFVFC